ncbi:hypothetical protein CULT_2270001 [[Clostridium] ultunense Esp]|nr:hypothetical protein CULT_2270001 [[Clostridium] ultunense Esp]
MVGRLAFKLPGKPKVNLTKRSFVSFLVTELLILAACGPYLTLTAEIQSLEKLVSYLKNKDYMHRSAMEQRKILQNFSDLKE